MPAAEPGTTTVVVPCHDEAARLDVSAFREFAAPRAWLRFLMVDDGSRDGTRLLLEDLVKEPRFSLLAFDRNRGKAEAVRLGLLEALDTACDYVGYFDADLATPLPELDRFRAALQDDPRLEWVLGSRVRLLGHHIERHLLRHYFGRVAATVASALLRLPVYDTQCGAKLMRATPALRDVLARSFLTRWEFDVELLARWLVQQNAREGSAAERLLELPVHEWRDVPGSKLRLADFLRAPRELWRIYRAHPELRGRR